jgi:hypothetical protein
MASNQTPTNPDALLSLIERVKENGKNDLFDYRKQTIELLFQRLIQSAELKECRVKGQGRNGAFVLANTWVY